ncbi:glycerophosphoryl diester phosphodiesterase membrane domain-containing protein [Microbacterium betulae]|uniref:Glycerophosphoryl diester phosphodiesterase membrane domain-containing protein n=1 Tax=Microbacterium betulae TaxID=2981139 RepID=A0AA97FLE8_9MICO|nr:glycerophosphoryl diester phosphodiesterase membrane domain-containing protein [Microbacterium sp. AB]WOF24204.1 glycerophosphoryl diester phosphodiesterase membrane domain-containing protein [Microbacterium sp. AB]
MTAEPRWTPAPRGGLIPLYPLGFGTILGKSFGALRGNPRVLLGFAMAVQIVSTLIGTAAIGAVAFATFSRLDTVAEFSEEYELIAAGSALVTALVTIAVLLVTGVLGIIVQAVVVGEVAHASLGERATLARIWARVRPVVWRLIGYYALLVAAVAAAVAVLVGIVAGLAIVETWAGVLAGVLALVGGIVLYAWLGTKLFVVPSAIILEHATIRGGIARSWRLIGGRFWQTFGVIVLIGLIMNTAAYAVGMPFSFLGGAFTSVFAPTGDPDASAVIAMVLTVAASQIVTLVVSSIGVVVQATSSALVYIDARMRREGIDLRMQSYVERRDAGAADAGDPYAFDPGAVAPPRAPEPWQVAPPAPPYGQAPPQYPQAPPYGQAPPYPHAPSPFGQAVPPAPDPGRPAPRWGQYAPTTPPPPAPAEPVGPAAPSSPPAPDERASGGS